MEIMRKELSRNDDVSATVTSESMKGAYFFSVLWWYTTAFLLPHIVSFLLFLSLKVYQTQMRR